MWFATRWVFLIRFRDKIQETFPIMERVVLLKAFDHEEARKTASTMAENELKEFTGTFHYAGGRPADLEFIGIKQVDMVSSVDGGTSVSLDNGCELTCFEYEIYDYFDAKKLILGEPVEVVYVC